MAKTTNRVVKNTPVKDPVNFIAQRAINEIAASPSEDVQRGAIQQIVKQKAIALYKAYNKAVIEREETLKNMDKFCTENPRAEQYIKEYAAQQQQTQAQ